MTSEERLTELRNEYGDAQCVSWLESRLNQLERNRDPVRRRKMLDRAKERREEQKLELMTLQDELRALKAKLKQDLEESELEDNGDE